MTKSIFAQRRSPETDSHVIEYKRSEPLFAYKVVKERDVFDHTRSEIKSIFALLATAVGLPAALAATVAAKLATGDTFPFYWRYNLARLLDTVGLGDLPMQTFLNHTPEVFVAHFAHAYHAMDSGWVSALAGMTFLVVAGVVGAILLWRASRPTPMDEPSSPQD